MNSAKQALFSSYLILQILTGLAQYEIQQGNIWPSFQPFPSDFSPNPNFPHFEEPTNPTNANPFSFPGSTASLSPQQTFNFPSMPQPSDLSPFIPQTSPIKQNFPFGEPFQSPNFNPFPNPQPTPAPVTSPFSIPNYGMNPFSPNIPQFPIPSDPRGNNFLQTPLFPAQTPVIPSQTPVFSPNRMGNPSENLGLPPFPIPFNDQTQVPQELPSFISPVPLLPLANQINPTPVDSPVSSFNPNQFQDPFNQFQRSPFSVPPINSLPVTPQTPESINPFNQQNLLSPSFNPNNFLEPLNHLQQTPFLIPPINSFPIVPQTPANALNPFNEPYNHQTLPLLPDNVNPFPDSPSQYVGPNYPSFLLPDSGVGNVSPVQDVQQSPPVPSVSPQNFPNQYITPGFEIPVLPSPTIKPVVPAIPQYVKPENPQLPAVKPSNSPGISDFIGELIDELIDDMLKKSRQKVCPVNEGYSECVNPCNDCKTQGHCHISDCKGGCDCKTGYHRNKQGKCIKKRECSIASCPPNEQLSDCANPCNDCETRGNCQFLVCNKGCDCNPKFYRDKDGTCIPENQCPITSCPPNEQPSDCANPCNDCETRGNCQFLVCNKGCDCNPKFYRDKDGTCIPENQCPNISCPPNEEPSECVSPCNDCETRGTCEILECKKGCDCKPGHYRNKDGICVREDICPITSCPINEEPSDCVVPCNDCEIRGKCQFFACRRGCDCKPRYYRNQKGTCIRQKDCPRNCKQKEEEYYSCMPDCTNQCGYKPGSPCDVVCNSGCFCRHGLVKDIRGKCVYPEQCGEFACKPDEEFYQCMPDCTHRCDYKRGDVCPAICRSGCFCRREMVLNNEGRCVYPHQCQKQDCSPEEEYYPCVPNCMNRCDYKPGEVCTAECQPGCFCREGLLQNDLGECVPPERCLNRVICKPDEEYYECIPDCMNRCDFKRGDVCAAVCTPGCFCLSHLLKNEMGQCVRQDQCEITACKEDEEYFECKPDCTNRCDYRKDQVCLAVCASGCYCKRHLVKNRLGECVIPELCEDRTCKLDEEYYDCVPDCKNKCSFKPGTLCPAICKSGCFCRQGLVLNDKGKCVSQDKCEKCVTCEQNSLCRQSCARTCKGRNRTCLIRCISRCDKRYKKNV